MQICLGLEGCEFVMHVADHTKISVLRGLQKVLTSGHAERAFLMQNKHHKGAAYPVMLGPAFQTWRSLEKLHDKSQNIPDPDIFAFDTMCALLYPTSTGNLFSISSLVMNIFGVLSCVKTSPPQSCLADLP